MIITRAEKADLPEILELQYSAYQSEAALVGSRDIQPLRQTLAELESELALGPILKAVDENGELIGSVRGHIREDTLNIGKLMVRPDRQGGGIGTALLEEMERACPQPRYELFTSSLSEGNIRLYERAGYRRFREKTVSAGLTMVYLEKCNEDTAAARNAGQ